MAPSLRSVLSLPLPSNQKLNESGVGTGLFADKRQGDN